MERGEQLVRRFGGTGASLIGLAGGFVIGGILHGVDHAVIRAGASVLDVIGGHDPLDSTSIPGDVPDVASAVDRGVEGLRIGLVQELCAELDPDVRARVDAAVAASAAGPVPDRAVHIDVSLHRATLTVMDAADELTRRSTAEVAELGLSALLALAIVLTRNQAAPGVWKLTGLPWIGGSGEVVPGTEGQGGRDQVHVSDGLLNQHTSNGEPLLAGCRCRPFS